MLSVMVVFIAKYSNAATCEDIYRTHDCMIPKMKRGLCITTCIFFCLLGRIWNSPMFYVSCPTVNMINITVNGCGFSSLDFKNIGKDNHRYIFISSMAGISYDLPVFYPGTTITNDIKCNATLVANTRFAQVARLLCTTYVGSWRLLYTNNLIACGGYGLYYSRPRHIGTETFWGYITYLFVAEWAIARTEISKCITGKWCMYLDDS